MSIQISKTSWHYRLVARMNSDYVVNRGLCVYMRKVMTSMMWLTLFASIIIFFVCFMFGGPVAFWLAYFDVIEMSKNIKGYGIISQGIWLGCGAIFGINEAHEYLKERSLKKGPKPTKKPSVFREYLKAKKQKVCPNIEFV